MSEMIPAGRMQLEEQAARQFPAMYRFEASIELDPGLRELVKIRASQINGCAFCIDMHWKDAHAASEREERLYMLDAWRESPLYSERERAALELCEAMTLIAERDVSDEVGVQARAEFEARELAQLIFAITAINAGNRLMITTRTEPGHYEPALRAAA
jgi:AhpD family alkylhydroperoxidase